MVVGDLHPKEDDLTLLKLALTESETQPVFSKFLQDLIHPIPMCHQARTCPPAISSCSTWFMNRWKVAGAFCSPNHMTAGSKRPRGVKKAQRCWCSGQTCMDGNPPFASIFEYIVAPFSISTVSRMR